MTKIKANHYIDTTVFHLEEALNSFKAYATKYFNNLNIGITSEQFVLLDSIYCNPGISQKELAELTIKNLSNVTRMLSVLEEKNLVYREIDKRNNYLIKRLYLTSEGKALIDNNISDIKDIFSTVFENFSEKDIEKFKELAIRFKKNFS